jgi:hypothetical protein
MHLQVHLPGTDLKTQELPDHCHMRVAIACHSGMESSVYLSFVLLSYKGEIVPR